MQELMFREGYSAIFFLPGNVGTCGKTNWSRNRTAIGQQVKRKKILLENTDEICTFNRKAAEIFGFITLCAWCHRRRKLHRRGNNISGRYHALRVVQVVQVDLWVQAHRRCQDYQTNRGLLVVRALRVVRQMHRYRVVQEDPEVQGHPVDRDHQARMESKPLGFLGRLGYLVHREYRHLRGDLEVRVFQVDLRYPHVLDFLENPEVQVHLAGLGDQEVQADRACMAGRLAVNSPVVVVRDIREDRGVRELRSAHPSQVHQEGLEVREGSSCRNRLDVS